jgi:hypothetical protein
MPTDAEPQPVPQPQRVPVPTTYGAMSGFERKLAGILNRAESEAGAQSMLLTLVVREIHTIKWILWWVLIIVPIVVVVFGWLMLAAAPHALVSTSTFGN